MAAEKRTADQDRIALRRLKAVELRGQRKGFQEIADTLGISVGQAHADVRAAMAELAQEAEENVRAERGSQLSRLERALDIVEDVLGSVTLEGTTPLTIGAERELKLKALDRLVKLEERRAKLLGLDAPEKKDVTATVSAAATPESAAKLVRETFGGHALPKDDDVGQTGDPEPSDPEPVPAGTPAK